jgi:predicted DNA-binding protein YlxM (UPF0122 family)
MLEQYEEKLALFEKFEQRQQLLQTLKRQVEHSPDATETISALENLE